MEIFHFFEINRYTNNSLIPAKELKDIIINLIIEKKKHIKLTNDKRILIMKLFSSSNCANIEIYLSRKASGKYFFVVKCEEENVYINFSEELNQEELKKITEG